MNRAFIREHNALFVARLRSSAKWLASLVGADELLLTLALGLIVVGLWPIAVKWLGTGLPSLIPAGIVILWLALPSRAPMILRTAPPEKPTRRVA